MQIKLALLGLLIGLGTTVGGQAKAESEVYNGGTCVPYPPTTTNAIAYAHWLYRFPAERSLPHDDGVGSTRD